MDGIDHAAEILAASAAAWAVTPEKVKSPERNAQIVAARQLATALMRHASDPPPAFSAIANILGYKDHTNACHALKAFESEPEESRQKRLFRALIVRYTTPAEAGAIPPAAADGEPIHTTP
jgi:chromosomal replication initiation ATPase DnaA